MTMTLISTVTVGAGGGYITFTNIPQTYTDLKIVLSGRGSRASVLDDILVRFNDDAGSNYSSRWLYGTGTSASSTTYDGVWAGLGYVPAASITASTFGNTEIYIPNYAGASIKSVSADTVNENNGTDAWMSVRAAKWNSTAAINKVYMVLGFTSFDQNTTASLYGITKGNGLATVS